MLRWKQRRERRGRVNAATFLHSPSEVSAEVSRVLSSQNDFPGPQPYGARPGNHAPLRRSSQAADSAAGAVAPSIVHQVLASAGVSLPASLRADAQARLGIDFAGVRVHADATAAASAAAVDAEAYTVGRHVVFGAGRFDPSSGTGAHLVIHELAHVAQQRDQKPVGPLEVDAHDSELEREADRIATGDLASARETQTGAARRPTLAPGIAAASSRLLSRANPRPGGWNADDRNVTGTWRIQITGLTQGLTVEKSHGTAEGVQHGAVAIVPKSITPANLEVLLHLHGHNIGERERDAPSDTGLAKGTVRDVEADLIPQQIAASGRNLIAILPQGTTGSRFGITDTHAYVTEALAQVVAHVNALDPSKHLSTLAPVRIVLSGHSGGGLEAVQAARTPVGSGGQSDQEWVASPPLLLFDAINGPQELNVVATLAERWLADDKRRLLSHTEADARILLNRRGLKLRSTWTGGIYEKTNTSLKARRDAWFASNGAALGALAPILLAQYVVEHRRGIHEFTVGTGSAQTGTRAGVAGVTQAPGAPAGSNQAPIAADGNLAQALSLLSPADQVVLPAPAPATSGPSGTAPPTGVVQPKLAVGRVDDPLEREADGIADRIMRMPDPVAITPCGDATVQPKCEACKEGKSEVCENGRGCSQELARAGARDAVVFDATAAPRNVQEVISTPGRALESSTRAFFEPRFGYDFSSVRVHTDSVAAESALSVGALAYTVGKDIVLGDNRYSQHAGSGGRLLAHELAHTIQQQGGTAVVPRGRHLSRVSTAEALLVQRQHTSAAAGSPTTHMLGSCRPVQDDLRPTAPWPDLQRGFKARCSSAISDVAGQAEHAWSDILHGRLPSAPHLPDARSSVDCACANLSPKNAAKAAMTVVLAAGPLAALLFWHFLGASGTPMTINVAEMITRSAGVRAKIRQSIARGGMSGTTRLEQNDYHDRELQFAYGAIDCVQWQVVSPTKHSWRSDPTTQIRVSMLDYYEFHPNRPGVSQCAHAACVECVASGEAKNFWTSGDAVVTWKDLQA